jgi:hypothetical protein
MFEEVSCAICLVRLCPGSSINPHSDRRRLRPGGVFRSNLPLVSTRRAIAASNTHGQAVGEGC